MARHTIGNKRGSVRGAPPQVYIPFSSFTDESDPGHDPFAETITLFKRFVLFGLGWLLIFFLLTVLWAVGILPDELADY